MPPNQPKQNKKQPAGNPKQDNKMQDKKQMQQLGMNAKGKGMEQGKPDPSAQKQKMPPEDQQQKPKIKVPQDEMFKFEMQYMNGGFNNGVLVKPDKNGKALLEISIYGGGEKKNMSVGPLPQSIQKLIQAYEISAQKNQDNQEITGELKKYFKKLSDTLSIEVISILQEADKKVLEAIKRTFKQVQ